MTLEPEEIHPHIPGVSRTGTHRRPSGGQYSPAHSEYGDERDHHRPILRHSPEGVPVIPIVPSEHGRPHPAHLASETESIEHANVEHIRLPSSHGELPHRPDSRLRDGTPVAEPFRPLPIHAQPSRSTIHPATIQPPPRHATATPFDLRNLADDQARLDALEAVARNLHATEGQLEDEFRHHEEERDRIFADREQTRDQEAQARAAAIWQQLETRLAALPAPSTHFPERPQSEFESERIASDKESIASIRTLAQQAASQHASDVMETIRLEREDAAREREQLAAERAQLMSEISAEKDHVIREKDIRIETLEEELAQLRSDLEAEKQQRATEDAEMRERERTQLMEHDDAVRSQLADITNLVQEQRDMCETKKVLMDSRWEDKQTRRDTKEAQMIELRDMVLKIHDDMENDRMRNEDERRESKEGLEKIIDDLQRQNAEQRELLTSLSESWRADCERHHEETINAVKSTANEQVSFNVQGYLDDFSRALATEVRMLLGEVGRIREERRALQHEIGDLLCIKSKYGPGGEYEPDWKPPGPPPGPPPPPDVLPPHPDPSEGPPPIKPAWRTHNPRLKKKKKDVQVPPAASTSAQMPQAGPAHMMVPPGGYLHPQQQQQQGDVRRQLTSSWATWQPERGNMTPPSVEPTLVVPGRSSPGLFGPRTPTSSMYENEHHR
ncbi:hypothetical protein B0H34DRAFT_722842 [Crassisporium funariophilum]|nr:hypothetical protein B0H34DRAFT_722842 [Crassisporium funariophilum]